MKKMKIMKAEMPKNGVKVTKKVVAKGPKKASMMMKKSSKKMY